jgi:hypothetical protein
MASTEAECILVIVTGSRDWTDRAIIHSDLLACERPGAAMKLVQGGCPTGADAIAAEYALRRGWNVVTVKADWRKYGRAAGPIRNQQMIETYAGRAFRVLAYSKNNSPGTANTIAHARRLCRDKLVIRELH